MRLNITGDTKTAQKFLARIIHELENTGPVFNEIADALRDASQRQYDSGAGWRKLKPDTVRRKGSSKILVLTGKLRDSFAEANSQYSKLKVTDNSVSIASTLSYATFQGSGRNPAKIQYRDAEKAVAEIYERFLQLRGR